MMRTAREWTRRSRGLTGRLLVGALVASVTVAVPTVASGSVSGTQSLPRSSDADVLADRYIVVYEDDHNRGVRAETDQREDELGFTARKRYNHVLDGFAARLGPSQLRALERDPEVAFVTEDRRVAMTASGSVGGTQSLPRSSDADVRANRYIVIYEDDHNRGVRAETDQREDALGFTARKRYNQVLDGFAAKLAPSQLRALERDPEVALVTEDRRVAMTAGVPLAPGESTPPTGVRRIRAATTATTREASGVNVAVIDTGIQLDHADLNAVDGVDCIEPGTPATDGNGHGTHVAGTIGAKNDGAGVVGVAPGTKTYAVRVLDNNGSGSWSSVICGIDWVTANAEALDIGVANMSLGGLGPAVRSCESTTDALHQAICGATDAGVNFVVAAGNNGWDFDYTNGPNVPAVYPEVLTVTAVSDSDGESAGGGGSPGCRSSEQDDTPASFSNYATTGAAQAHTIAAPGVCIRSTWTGSGYETISGTSMAAPHMAGIVALCQNEAGVNGECAGKNPAQVITHLRARAGDHNAAEPDYGFLGDPLHSPSASYFGFLTALNTSEDPPAEDPPAEDPPAEDPPLPIAETSAQQPQKASRDIKVSVFCEEACMATSQGKISILGKNRSHFVLKRIKSEVVAGDTVMLKLSLKGNRAERRLMRLLKKGNRAKAMIGVRVTNAAGGYITERVKVRLRR